jgi:hypothetical protein
LGVIVISALVSWSANILYPSHFWESGDDYVYLSLAHALNLEARLADGRYYRDVGLVGHPGIPFYLVSWLSLRAAALSAGAADAVNYGLSSANEFYFSTRVAAALITITSLFFSWKAMHGLPSIYRLLAIAAFFSCTKEAFLYAFFVLGNETFAFPIFTMMLWSIRSVAHSRDGQLVCWGLLGAVAAFAYTVKLLYLNVLVAGLATAVADAWFLHRLANWLFIRQALKRVICVLIGFLVVSSTMIYLAMGTEGAYDLFQFHYSVYSHAGLYGKGDGGVFSMHSLYTSALSIVRNSPILLLLAVIALAFGTALRAICRDRFSALCAVASSVAMLVGMAAALKHYEPHYLLAVGAAFPLAFRAIFASGSLRPMAAVAIVGCLSITLLASFNSLMAKTVQSNEVGQDEASILAMPLAAGEARLWTYRVPSRYFVEGFVAMCSGVPDIIALANATAAVDTSSYAQIPKDYRYVVLDKGYFKDPNDVAARLGAFTGRLGISSRPDDVIHEFRQTLVVERIRPAGP